jgi:hypothetical protein
MAVVQKVCDIRIHHIDLFDFVQAEERFIQRKSEMDQAAAQRAFVKPGKDQERLEAKLQKLAQSAFQAGKSIQRMIIESNLIIWH